MGLIVALDDNMQASGELFWDDGDSRGVRSSSLPDRSSSNDLAHLPSVEHLIYSFFFSFFYSLTATVESGAYLHHQFSVSSVRCFSLLRVLHSHLPSG